MGDIAIALIDEVDGLAEGQMGTDVRVRMTLRDADRAGATIFAAVARPPPAGRRDPRQVEATEIPCVDYDPASAAAPAKARSDSVAPTDPDGSGGADLARAA